MARLKIPQVQNFTFFCLLLCCFTKLASANVELNEDNWRQILDGEWMVEFYAPWCPACGALAPAWRELAAGLRARGGAGGGAGRAGAVDVTGAPGLSGRFVVTALPTIYHVKDGEFRQYKGPRDSGSMLDYVEKERWRQTEPEPSWRAPDSLQMGLVAYFFKLSQGLRGVHNTLMETYGLPTWGSYLIFAVATIFIGALLGLVLVCAIDLLYPPRKFDKVLINELEVERRRELERKASEADQELINDDIVDDADDAEQNSPPDSEEEEEEGGERAAGGAGDERGGAEVRRRRTRRAD